jgi:hypothetical protein
MTKEVKTEMVGIDADEAILTGISLAVRELVLAGKLTPEDTLNLFKRAEELTIAMVNGDIIEVHGDAPAVTVPREQAIAKYAREKSDQDDNSDNLIIGD